MANLILWNSFDSKNVPVRTVGPHQVANWLMLHGYTVKVIDFCCLLSTKDLVDITRKHIDHTTIGIGVSTTFWNEDDPHVEPNWIAPARALIHTTFPNLDWILGGANSETRFLKLDWIKIHGQGEDPLLRYMDERCGKTILRQKFDVKNLTNPLLNPYSDLGILSHEVLPIQLSRGCQFICSFCTEELIGRKKNTYLRDFSLLEQELRENYDKYGLTRYVISDDTVNESEEKIAALADIASRLPFKLEWVGYNRLDLIGSRKHSIEQLRISGLRGAHFGIESFGAKASKVIGKAWNGKHGKEFLLKLKEQWGNDITFHLSLITGLPDQTYADLMTDVKWCIGNQIPSWVFRGLSISRSRAKSEFERNYSKFGYRFPHPMNDFYWENNLWNKNSAAAIADKLNEISNPYLKISSWDMSTLATLGFSFDDLINKKINDIDWILVDTLKTKMISDYVSNQLA